MFSFFTHPMQMPNHEPLSLIDKTQQSRTNGRYSSVYEYATFIWFVD